MIVSNFFLGFLKFWAVVFVIATTLVMIFKKEKNSTEDDESDNVIDTYKQLYKIIKLKSVIGYSIILLTAKVCFFFNEIYQKNVLLKYP